MSAPIRGEVGRFLISGAVNTLATYGIYLALLTVLDYTLAYTIAYVCGVGLAYMLNTAFVFRAPCSLHTFVRFPLVYVVQYVVGAIVLNVAVRMLGVPRQFALIASILVTLPVTFVLSRLLLKGNAPFSPSRSTGKSA